MIPLTAENAADYLYATGRLKPGIRVEVEWLTWGVSNVVLRVHPEIGDDFVVKQSREQLRTQAEWFSRLDRIWREMDLMTLLAPLLPPGAVPRLIFEDRENYLFAMEAVPARHVVWKSKLLNGVAEPWIAETLGDYLAAIHRETAFDRQLQDRWGDPEVFTQLRVDPYYRRIAEVHPDLHAPIAAMIDELFQTPVCIVHGDFSPKNVLMTPGKSRPSEGEEPVGRNTGATLTLVDYETGYFGDPAFDLGFFLSHLLLKTVLHAPRREEFLHLSRSFWSRYVHGLGALTPSGAFAESELQRRTIPHLAGCMLARIDGKSTIDYLPESSRQEFVRTFCRRLLFDPPIRLDDVFCRLNEELSAARF